MENERGDLVFSIVWFIGAYGFTRTRNARLCWRYAHTHYRRATTGRPQQIKPYRSFSILNSDSLRAAYGGCSLDAHCGGCLHSPFAKNKKERAQRSLLEYSKGIQSSSLTRASRYFSPLLKTRSAQKCKHILLIILNTRLIKRIYAEQVTRNAAGLLKK